MSAPTIDLDALFRAKLASSGLDLKDGVRLGMSVISAIEVAQRNLWKGHPKTAALVIPYLNPSTGEVELIRYRSLYDPVPKPARFPKYVQPLGSGVSAYYPSLRANWLRIFHDHTQPLIITEGELKAAKACKEGFPTIGLGGVWNFRQQKVLLDSLAKIAWEGRKVYITYDSDLATNEHVERARRELANILIIPGAEVYRVDLPSLGGAKTGLDDFLMVRGAEAFAQLVETAPRMTVDWTLFYQWGDNNPLPTAANVLVALRHAPELQGAFAFEEMRRSAVLMRAIPGDATDIFPRTANDTDDGRLLVWLQKEGKITKLGLDAVRIAVDIYAHENTFHVVRNALNALRWAKEKLLDVWLTRTFGAESSPYTSKIGRMFIIAMVARVMQPGCKMDYMLVVIGSQGKKKSMVFEILAGEWFDDDFPPFDGDSKRASAHIKDKWLIEDAELAARSKASIEDEKKFISRRVEKYTPMYGRREVHEPRQCVFAGTTNEHIFLKDETGNRRFWPFEAFFPEADIEWITANRDQIFAEAVAAYRKGEHWWPDRGFEEKYIIPEQDLRFSGGEWDEAISKYLDMKLAADASPRVTTNEIAEFSLQIVVKDRRPGLAQKIGNTLRRLGWEESRSHGIRWFEPGPKVRRSKF